MLLWLGGCQAAVRPSPTSVAGDRPAPTPWTASTSQPPRSPAAAGPSPSPTGLPAACTYGQAARLAEIQDRAIDEASGLATSRRRPGLHWTINDSGNDPLVYGFDDGGRLRARVRLSGTWNVDWEALHAGPGAGGEPALYVGDIGDNGGDRPEVVVYRLVEPALSEEAAKPAELTLGAEAMALSYADGPRDAEALLVHPRTGELVVVSKDLFGKARVYHLTQPFAAGERAVLQHVADLDFSEMGPLAGAVTDGAVSPDGRRIVLRTYVAVLEYDLPDGASLASVWAQAPRASELDDGRQGEGITYRADGLALLSIGEGAPARLWQSQQRC